MLKYNDVEPSQWRQEIYSHQIFLLCVRIDLRLRFVTSSFVWTFHTFDFCSISTEKIFYRFDL